MNAFAALLLVIASQDIPAGYVKFFEKGVENKAGLVKSAEERIAAQEIKVTQAQHEIRVQPPSHGSTLKKKADAQKQILISMRNALDDLKQTKPFTFLDEDPQLGEVGMIYSCRVVAIYDDKTMLVRCGGGKGDNGKNRSGNYALLTVPSTKRIVVGTKDTTPNHVFVVTETVRGGHPEAEEAKPARVAALKELRSGLYFTAEVVNPAILNKYRAAHAETQKQAAK